MAASDDVKSFWDAVAKGIAEAKDPVGAAVKAIADGEKDKERLAKEGVKAAVKAQQDADRERKRLAEEAMKTQRRLAEEAAKAEEKIRDHAFKTRLKMVEKEVEAEQKAIEEAMKAEQKAIADALEEQEREKKKAADKAKKDAEDEAKKKADLNKKVFEGLTTGVAKVGAVVTSAMNALTSFGSSLSTFVEKANPVAVMRFGQAVDDMQAVIGRALTPVLERVTIMVRGMGDAFVSLSDPAQKFIAAMTGGAGLGAVLAAAAGAAKLLLASLGPIPIIVGLVGGAIAGVAGTMASGKQVSEAFGRVMKVVGTIIESLAAVVLPLVAAALDVVVPLLDALADAITFVTDSVLAALAAFGLAGDYDPKAKSSVGAAVRQASIGDIGSFANKAYSSAYGAASQDVPKAQLTQLEQINKKLDALGYLADGTRKEDRQVMGSSGLGRAINPNERGTDGKSNLERGLDNITSGRTAQWARERMASLFD